jgi:hypothetical protein
MGQVDQGKLTFWWNFEWAFRWRFGVNDDISIHTCNQIHESCFVFPSILIQIVTEKRQQKFIHLSRNASSFLEFSNYEITEFQIEFEKADWFPVFLTSLEVSSFRWLKWKWKVLSESCSNEMQLILLCHIRFLWWVKGCFLFDLTSFECFICFQDASGEGLGRWVLAWNYGQFFENLVHLKFQSQNLTPPRCKILFKNPMPKFSGKIGKWPILLCTVISLICKVSFFSSRPNSVV